MADFNQSPLDQATVTLTVRQPALLATSGVQPFRIGWLQRPFNATATLAIRQPALLTTSGVVPFRIGWLQRPLNATTALSIGAGSSTPPVTVPTTELVWPVALR